MVKRTKSSESFQRLCTPARIYFAIAVVSVIFGIMKKMPMGILLTKIIFAFIWAFILGWLCKKGYSNISWLLVLLPYIVMLLAVFKIAKITQHKDIFKAVGLQGVYGGEPLSMMGGGKREALSMPNINFSMGDAKKK